MLSPITSTKEARSCLPRRHLNDIAATGIHTHALAAGNLTSAGLHRRKIRTRHCNSKESRGSNEHGHHNAQHNHTNSTPALLCRLASLRGNTDLLTAHRLGWWRIAKFSTGSAQFDTPLFSLARQPPARRRRLPFPLRYSLDRRGPRSLGCPRGGDLGLGLGITFKTRAARGLDQLTILIPGHTPP